MDTEARRLQKHLFRDYAKPDRLAALTVLFEDGVVSRKALREVLATIWIGVESPSRSGVAKARVVRMFRAAGFLSDNPTITTPPPEGLTIYRGCHPQYRLGLSWTTDQVKARWFAQRFGSIINTQLYRAQVSGRRILAMFGGRKEAEVVVNPRGLRTVVLNSTPHPSPIARERRSSRASFAPDATLHP